MSWRCRWFGHKRPLVWRHRRERPVMPRGRSQEMFYASGLGALAEWNGWCPRCNAVVEWSQVSPSVPSTPEDRQ
jgi:hypothetical protein